MELEQANQILKDEFKDYFSNKNLSDLILLSPIMLMGKQIRIDWNFNPFVEIPEEIKTRISELL